MTDPLSHECRAERTCVARTSTGAAVTMKPATLCPHCIGDIQRCADDLPALQKALRAFIGKGTTSAWGETVSASKEPPLPLNVTVLDLIGDIEDELAAVGKLPIRDLVNQQFGVDEALIIRKLHGKADNIVGLSANWERKGAPCPVCQTFTLGGWSGSGNISCTNCGTGITQFDYEQNCIIQVREVKDNAGNV